MNKLKYFTASWCGPCRFFKPSIEELIKEGENIEIIDIDSNPTESREYEVMSVPTLIFEKNSEIYARTTGVIPKGQVKEMLAYKH
jgi:thioredoxin 1